MYSSHGNYPETEIELTLEDAQSVSHPGPCDADVEALAKELYVAKQLARIPADSLRLELREYGAWDSDELADHSSNLLRWLWIAGNDIVEDQKDQEEN